MTNTVLRLWAIPKTVTLFGLFLLFSGLIYGTPSARAQTQEVYQNGRVTTIFRDLPTKQVIHLIGELNASDKEIKYFSKIYKIDPRKELILNLSGYKGGKTTSAQEFVRVVKGLCEARRDKNDRAQSCDFTTYVNDRHVCASACIIPYMAGKKRVACDNSRFGFHALQYRFGVIIKGSKEKSIEFLTSAGVSKSWATKNADIVSSLELTFLSPSEMVGSNIVTILDRQCDLVLPSL